MSRIPRQCFEGEYFHLMEQGINREFIFEKDKDKKIFLNILLKKIENTKNKICAYCIMDNHVHILLKSNEINDVTKVIQRTNTSYAIYYNSSRNRVGYVFRDRYRAEPIHDQFHLENCIRYIHNNPLEAGIINNLKEYKFSSYNDYMYGRIDLELIKEIYGTANFEEYKDKISGSYDDCNFIDVDNQFGRQNLEQFDEVCRKYSKLDYSNKDNVKKVSLELRKRCGVKHEKVIDFMGIPASTYYRKIK